MEELLKRAIETQEYEKAAEYRDALRALETEAKQSEATGSENVLETEKVQKPENGEKASGEDRAEA